QLSRLDLRLAFQTKKSVRRPGAGGLVFLRNGGAAHPAQGWLTYVDAEHELIGQAHFVAVLQLKVFRSEARSGRSSIRPLAQELAIHERAVEAAQVAQDHLRQNHLAKTVGAGD